MNNYCYDDSRRELAFHLSEVFHQLFCPLWELFRAMESFQRACGGLLHKFTGPHDGYVHASSDGMSVFISGRC